MSATVPDDRDVRALTEHLLVVDGLEEARAEDMYLVYSEQGQEYRVDTALGACECDDAFYRGAECKHQRAAVLLSERELPEWVTDPDAVNAVLVEVQ